MSGSQRRSEYATGSFDLASGGRFSALIRVGDVGGGGVGKPLLFEEWEAPGGNT